MGLALGAALRKVRAVDRLTYYGRAMEPPPHPLFEPSAATDAGQARAEYHAGLPSPPTGTTVVVLAVPDAALPEVAYDLSRAGGAPPGCAALHLSGAVATDVLAPLHGVGYAVGTLHPLQTVADPWQSGEPLIGAAFGVSGEPVALSAARRIADELGGVAIVVPPKMRPRYHAAAVFASNYVLALLTLAARILAEVGAAPDEALRALLPLARTTIDNLDHLGALGALTGPVARGDVDTVRLHVSRLSDEERALYCGLGREVLRLAREAGLDPQRAEELDDLFATG